MAHTALDEDEIAEFRDPPAVLRTKVEVLAQFVRDSQHMIVYTGAGVSTSDRKSVD